MTAEHNKIKQGLPAKSVEEIASSLVSARIAARGLDYYPGSAPADLATAYLIQDRAIDLWSDKIGGWKVGRIPPAVEDKFGCDRLAGPIFATTIVWQANNDVPAMPVFADGFAAVEAEFVAVIREDAPAGKVHWGREEAEAMIRELRIGLEIASSPLVGINDLGPAVVASDFGNNRGLIVGPIIPDWQERDVQSLTCSTYVEDELVGEGGAFRLTGGVTRSVQFMLEVAAGRGRPLQAGAVVATGQTTGIHEVTPGQSVNIRFGGGDLGELRCQIKALLASQ
ncbi:MAG: fumarylacetoacetate hydrolase family protein [Woeseiaceae bacterium]